MFTLMMIEIVLVVVIGLLIGLLAFVEYQNRIERAKFINALLAKNAQEMQGMDLADKTEIKTEVPNKKEEFVPLEDLSDEEFKKAVL